MRVNDLPTSSRDCLRRNVPPSPLMSRYLAVVDMLRGMLELEMEKQKENFRQ
jgi:hypothetical protein